jgi:hypothetical protein
MNFFYVFTLLEQGVDRLFGLSGQAAEDFGEFSGIGPEGLHVALGAPQSGSCHHVHGLGDLLGFFDSCYFILNIF